MKLTDFYNEVAKVVDTGTTKISAAETRRVLSEAFKILAGLDAATVAKVLASGLEKAKGKKK